MYLFNVYKQVHLFYEGITMFIAAHVTPLSVVLLNALAMVEFVSTMQFSFR